MPEAKVGKVLGIAMQAGHGELIRNAQRAVAIEGGGLRDDASGESTDKVHFLASRQWQEIVRSLGTVLLWQTSLANVLVEADALADLVGKTIRLGEATLEITGMAKPHPSLDQIRPGLSQLLSGSGRCGVVGRAVRGGAFSVGDVLAILT